MPTSLSVLVPQLVERLCKLNSPEGRKYPGIMTGFSALDGMTLGLHPGDLTVVAAVPGMGKSALVLNIAQHVALREARPVLFFSLEVDRHRLTERLMSSYVQVPLQALRSGKLQDLEWARVAQASDKLARAHLVVDDRPALSIADVQARACEYAEQVGQLGLIVVDYLQLLNGAAASKPEDRAAELVEISRGLKSLARQLECPVIVTSQITSTLERRLSKRPTLSDLQAGAAIADDADVVILLYRDEYYNHMSKQPGVADLIVSKQRSGPVGTVQLAFSKSCMRFDDLEAAVGQDGEV